MSEETGFTEYGFYPRSPVDIENDYQVAGSGVFEEINYGPGDPLYQIFKVAKLREYQMELLTEQIVSGLTIENAHGVWLDKWGESRLVERRGPQKAGGYVHLTFESPDVGEYYELYGTQYLSKTNLTYTRSSSSTLQIYRYIPIIRGYGTIDYLPEPHVWITGIGYINNESDGSGGTNWTPDWDQSAQFFNWSGISSQPNPGEFFYVEITGMMTIRDDISSYGEGTGYNIGANIINSFINNPTLPSTTEVNNPYAITGGADWESDENYKNRLLRRTEGKYTLNELRTRAEEINGVRAAHVYQAVGDDRTSVSGDWSITIQDYQSGIQITGNDEDTSGARWSQRFNPGLGIMSLKNVVFRGYRYGFPPPLIVGFRELDEQTYAKTGIFDTFSVTPPSTTVQDMKIDTNYLRLSSLQTYCFEFWCSNASGATGSEYWSDNYWVLCTGAMSGNLGDGDIYTGLLFEPGGSSYDNNLIFKTQYGAAAYNIDLALQDGYSFPEVSDILDNKLDWVEGSGYAPIGVDYAINQAIPVDIYYTATLHVIRNPTSSFDAITDRVDYAVEKYIEGLYPGENVVYSEIYYQIMNDSEIWRVSDLKIYESGGTELEDEDIFITEGEVARFGGSSVRRG